MARLGGIDTQFFDDNGDPLSGGKLSFFDTGTDTPKTTYSDEDLTTPNTNPVVLDAYGVPGDIFFTGTAKIVLTDADDVQLRVMDPVDACCATEGGGGGEATPYWTFDTTVRTTSFAATAGTFYFADVNAAAGDITITLPASPAVGDRVGYANRAYHATRAVIIDGGSNIVIAGDYYGTSIEPEIIYGYFGFSFIYNGTNWLAYDSLNVVIIV